MGQGFSLATPSAGVTGIDVPELADLVYEKSLGNARFMKSVRARHRDGVVLVKVLVKPYTVSLESYRRKIIGNVRPLTSDTASEQHKALATVPNALPYQRAIETDTNGYLVRQYLYSSLYDRLSTRPFLEDIEKTWLAFQLLCALRDCHARDVCHGDIKAQNVLVTSWNWLFLSDFSSPFKPVNLPVDLPADFSYYFDTSGRRTCYIAPERFYPPDQAPPPDARLTPEMDVFSAGCFIAQMFLETEIFTLANLYSYRRGGYDPVITHLSMIGDSDLREMITHMIQLDPARRFSAERYLQGWRGTVFPEYFYDFLHGYMGNLTDRSTGNRPVSGEARNYGEPDARIDAIYDDFDRISYLLGHQTENRRPEKTEPPRLCSRLGLSHFPVRLSLPHAGHAVSDAFDPPEDDGTLIFLSLVVSSLRNTARSASKIRGCDILLAFAERLTDEAKLDRVLPYLLTLLWDECEMVVVAAIRSVAQLLQLVKVVTPFNAHVFADYILPRMETIVRPRGGPRDPLTRATYASCLGSLALSAHRFLAMTGGLRAVGLLTFTDPEVESGFDVATGTADDTQAQLTETLESHAKALVEDPDTQVRRAFLASVPELCIFFAARSGDVLLSHLNTYLNDRDWMLKCAFFDTIVGISTLLGSVSVEEFVLPLMTQALNDAEEHVIQEALYALAQLVGLGLISRYRLWDLVDRVARFTVHPNGWIRAAACELVSASTRYLTPAEILCFVQPRVRMFLKPDILPDFSTLDLLDTLRKPLTRNVFEQAVLWASKTEKGESSKPARKTGGGVLTATTHRGHGNQGSSQSLTRRARSEEDERWLSRLRGLGLGQDDEFKLLVLKEFIWRLSVVRLRDNSSATQTSEPPLVPQDVIKLKSLGITPQTILLYQDINNPPPDGSGNGYGGGGGTRFADTRGPYTIADALMDASVTLDSPGARAKLTKVGGGGGSGVHKSRLSGRAAASSPPQLSPVDSRRDSSRDSTGRRQSGLEAQRVAVTVAAATAAAAADGTGTVSDEPYASRRTIRHQSSALSLLDRKDGNKTGPETSTTEANAFGQVEGPSLPPSTSYQHQRHSSRTLTAGSSDGPMTTTTTAAATAAAAAAAMDGNVHPRHSYEGNDPSILKVLDSMYFESYPYDVVDFGPRINPVPRRRATTGPSGQSTEAEPLRLKGHMIATFAEHTGPINRVVVSPDHQFFITGGDDGTVRVWDTARLERNLSHRARLTYRGHGVARVLALCFVEFTHAFVSCADDGGVHVVKVETSLVGQAGESAKYRGLKVTREHKLPRGEHAVWAEHFRTETTSTLLLATSMSRIVATDLRTMAALYELRNPLHHGSPTCFVVDRRRHWLCVGTSHGVLDLWDLRFRARVRGWGLPGRSPIYRLATHPVRGSGRWVCVAGGTGKGEVTVWDLEQAACREVYHAAGPDTRTAGKRGKAYEALDVDADRGGAGMLGRFAMLEAEEDGGSGGGEAPGNGGPDRGFRAMLIGTTKVDEPAAAAAQGNTIVSRNDSGSGSSSNSDSISTSDGSWGRMAVGSAWMVTGGVDKKLRFWDLMRPERSTVFCGSDGGGDEVSPTYARSLPMASLMVVTEKTAATAEDDPAETRSKRDGHGVRPKGRTAARSSVLSREQGRLLRSHLDAVTDVAVLEVPYGVCVSVDRMGVVMVYQ